MGRSRRRRGAATVLVLCAALAAGWWLFWSPGGGSREAPAGATRQPARATVQHVVDGDTLYLMLEGERTKVRLLNVDAPELPRPDRAGECFGPEAAEFLARKLPPGSTVELEFDAEPLDRHGRTLAALSRGDEFVNETLVASGYATAMKVEPNVRFYQQLRTAQAQAEQGKLGMFDPANGCS